MIHIQQESWQWAAGLLRASSHIQRLLRGAPSPRRHVLRGVFPQGQSPSLIVTHSRAGTGTGSLVTQFFTVNHCWYFMSFARLSNPSAAFKRDKLPLSGPVFLVCLLSSWFHCAFTHAVSFSKVWNKREVTHRKDCWLVLHISHCVILVTFLCSRHTRHPQTLAASLGL